MNVSGMLSNGRLARHVADVGMHEFKRQLIYKAALFGVTVIVVDRWFPSSKKCSNCGFVLEELPLNVRRWTCPSCKTEHDRDVNAALNIQRLSLATVSCTGSYACGEDDNILGEAGIRPCYI
jgi:putative transposase